MSNLKKKVFEFKSSKLSTVADQMWQTSKNEFKAEQTSIKLDLGRTLDVEKITDSVNNAPDAVNCGSFIFGSRLTERVIVDSEDSKKSNKGAVNKKENDKQSKDSLPKSVSDVFQAIRQKSPKASFCLQGDKDASTSKNGKNFSDEALDYDSSSKTVSSSEPVEIFTGEEGEENVYNVTCKLHSFDAKLQKWIERGMATLRINRLLQSDLSEYRIVGRGTGNMRVLLNSRITSDMMVEKISSKRIKFSATTPDSHLPVLFLTTASEFVTEQLLRHLTEFAEIKKGDKRKRKVSDNDRDEGVIQAKKAIAKEY